jgi:hypothetical protein
MKEEKIMSSIKYENMDDLEKEYINKKVIVSVLSVDFRLLTKREDYYYQKYRFRLMDYWMFFD